MNGKPLFLLALIGTATLVAAPSHSEDATLSSPKIRRKSERAARAVRDNGYQPDTDVIDAPTTSVIENGSVSTRSRFYSRGGILQYLTFGVYPGVSLGASVSVDSIIGDEKKVRVRAPTAQVRYRFYEGDDVMPSVAVGFDGQGYRYNAIDRRFNQRQRGFYFVSSKELAIPGLVIHPSFNISDFNTNGIFGSLPVTLNVRDALALLVEWDNINNLKDSRFNAGIRANVNANFQLDFAVRAIGAGGVYGDGALRGPERIVQLKFNKAF